MKLTLIRHGTTRGNKERLYYGSTDLPLLEEGIAELRQRRETYRYPQAPRYYTSPLQRTQQTIRELYGPVEFTPVDELREMDFGVFEMRAEAELEKDEAFRHWWNEGQSTEACPNGESFRGVQVRALRAMADILAEQEDAVCVIHGGVIAALMVAWFPEGHFVDYLPHPGTGWQVTVENGRPVAYTAIPFARE